MVQKKNGNMSMCIDFTELNKACPKDPYPLPRIDIIIDQATGCEMLSLLDCFSGYHQVWMRREDEAKTGFTTTFGVFCFVRMPEGLRNAGATYNRMMKLILKEKIRWAQCVRGAGCAPPRLPVDGNRTPAPRCPAPACDSARPRPPRASPHLQLGSLGCTSAHPSRHVAQLANPELGRWAN
jgi:hypothetical protein